MDDFPGFVQLQQGNRNLGEALEILIRMNAKENPEDLKSLLSHPTLRVRSLAGALLLDSSERVSALDHVATGLNEALPLSTQKAILNALPTAFIGGVMALGCTVGQGITGMSTLAFGSFLALGAIFLGGVIGLKSIEEGSLGGAISAICSRD